MGAIWNYVCQSGEGSSGSENVVDHFHQRRREA